MAEGEVVASRRDWRADSWSGVGVGSGVLVAVVGDGDDDVGVAVFSALRIVLRTVRVCVLSSSRVGCFAFAWAIRWTESLARWGEEGEMECA